MKDAGIDTAYLDYSKISEKLVYGRCWKETRYYVGRVSNDQDNRQGYDNQQRFISQLENSHQKITVHLGRIEKKPAKNPISKELGCYLHNLDVKIDKTVYHHLQRIAQKSEFNVYVEKAVDVKLAIDMVIMAQRNDFDTAYLLSADGDFTPAVEAASSYDKKIFAASLSHGAQLAGVVHNFISLDSNWFSDCYSSR